MPPAHLLALGFLHVQPVVLLLLPAAVLAQGDPADHLLALHAAAVVDGDHERDIGELEESHLEDEGLLVDGVGLAPPDRRLTPRDLLTHRVQKCEFHIGVYKKRDIHRQPSVGKPIGNTYTF